MVKIRNKTHQVSRWVVVYCNYCLLFNLLFFEVERFSSSPSHCFNSFVFNILSILLKLNICISLCIVLSLEICSLIFSAKLIVEFGCFTTATRMLYSDLLYFSQLISVVKAISVISFNFSSDKVLS